MASPSLNYYNGGRCQVLGRDHPSITGFARKSRVTTTTRGRAKATQINHAVCRAWYADSHPMHWKGEASCRVFPLLPNPDKTYTQSYRPDSTIMPLRALDISPMGISTIVTARSGLKRLAMRRHEQPRNRGTLVKPSHTLNTLAKALHETGVDAFLATTGHAHLNPKNTWGQYYYNNNVGVVGYKAKRNPRYCTPNTPLSTTHRLTPRIDKTNANSIDFTCCQIPTLRLLIEIPPSINITLIGGRVCRMLPSLKR